MTLVHAWAILSTEKISYSKSSSSQNLKLSYVLSGWNQTFFVILSDVSSAKVGSTSPPTTWSVDEVVKFIEKSELAEHADMFKKHVSKFASYEYKSSFPPPPPRRPFHLTPQLLGTFGLALMTSLHPEKGWQVRVRKVISIYDPYTGIQRLLLV